MLQGSMFENIFVPKRAIFEMHIEHSHGINSSGKCSKLGQFPAQAWKN